MANMSFVLTNGATLYVEAPRPEMLGEATPLSFYAVSGVLPDGLSAALDAALPAEWSGPESDLRVLVLSVLGEQYQPSPSFTVGPRYQRPHVSNHPYPGMSDDPWAD